MLQSLKPAELDRLARSESANLPELQPLTWEMLSEMQQAGFTIGSHTKTHRILTRVGPSQLAHEAFASRRVLERRLQAPVEHFAHPDGQVDPPVVWAAPDAALSLP